MMLRRVMSLTRHFRRSKAQSTGATSLNEKILDYIRRNRHRALPPREQHLHPEILIPCHNHAAFLPYLLEVLDGCGVPVTVIDDNSAEDERVILAELGRRFGVKVIRNDTNLRQGGSINKAIGMSDNNLFLVANADDYILPGWVPYAIEQFRNHDIRLLGGLHICFFNHFPEAERHFAHILRTTAYRPMATLSLRGPEDARSFSHDNSIDMTMTGCTFLRSAWDFVGGFYALRDRVSIHDDRDFQMRVCAFFPIGISGELSALWRSNSSTGKGTT